jgi:mono/diheme cytochrome c family protein
MHRIRNWIVLALTGTALFGAPASAQDHGDVKRGAALALGVCIACHGVRHGEESNNLLAPPFADIAKSKGMSAIALNVALQSPHHAMPNIMLDPQERADVIAYILSLKYN